MQRNGTRARRIIRVTAHVVQMRRQLVATATRGVQCSHTDLNRSSLNQLVGLVNINSIDHVQMRHNRHISYKNGRARQVHNAQRQTRRHTRVLTGRNLVISINTRLLMLNLT